MKTILSLGASILALAAAAPTADARPRYAPHPAGHVYVSGYRSCGAPIYSQRYIASYRRCGTPVWHVRAVRAPRHYHVVPPPVYRPVCRPVYRPVVPVCPPPPRHYGRSGVVIGGAIRF